MGGNECKFKEWIIVNPSTVEFLKKVDPSVV